jgi:hypothetical protein
MSPTAIAAAFTGAFKSSGPGAGGLPDVEPLDDHVMPAAIDFAGLGLLAAAARGNEGDGTGWRW